jgi:hypothetical protein
LRELIVDQDVWEELARRGVVVAAVGFVGRAGRGGRVETVALGCPVEGEVVDVERRPALDELHYALAAPMWGPYGAFAGQPSINARLTWTLADRGIVIAGRRGGESFTEVLA